MINKLNYTNRLDIHSDRVEAEIVLDLDRYSLKINTDFLDLGFSEDAQLIIEIRSPGTSEIIRRDLGNLYSEGPFYDLNLAILRNPLESRLRFKVVREMQGKRLLVGQLDNFVPRVPHLEEDRKSLLKIAKNVELEVPWRVLFDSGEPILAIAGREGLYERRSFFEREFLLMNLSEIVRQVFDWIVSDTEIDNETIRNGWIDFFIEMGCPSSFFEELHSSEEDDDLDRKREMRDSVCANFTQKHGFFAELSDLFHLEEEEQQ